MYGLVVGGLPRALFTTSVIRAKSHSESVFFLAPAQHAQHAQHAPDFETRRFFGRGPSAREDAAASSR